MRVGTVGFTLGSGLATLAAIAAVAAVAGCSPAAAARPHTLGDIAAAVHCTEFDQDKSFLLYAQDHGSCTLANGHQVDVVRFASRDNATRYVAAANQNGVFTLLGVDGNGWWSLSGEDTAEVQQLATAAFHP